MFRSLVLATALLTGCTTPTATAPATTRPPSGDGMSAYREARDAICEPLTEQVLAILPELDAAPSPPPAAKAELIEQIVAIQRQEADELNRLTPPASLADAHDQDVDRLEEVTDLLEAEAAALRQGDVEEAIRLDEATGPITGAREEQFEYQHGLAGCP